MLTERDIAKFGMEVIRQFLDALDERMEEVGKDTITREELHKIGRVMNLEFAKLLAKGG